MAKNKWKNTHSISTSKKKKNGKWKTSFHGNILKEKGKPYSLIIIDDPDSLKPNSEGKIVLQVWPKEK